MGFSGGAGAGGMAEGRAAADALGEPFVALEEGTAGVSLATGSGVGGWVSELQAVAPTPATIYVTQLKEMLDSQTRQGRAAGRRAW